MLGNYKSLRVLVYAMGITMIVGMLTISYAIINGNIIKGNICESSIELQPDVDVEIMGVDADYIYILQDNRVLQFNSCSGKLAKVITLG